IAVTPNWPVTSTESTAINPIYSLAEKLVTAIQAAGYGASSSRNVLTITHATGFTAVLSVSAAPASGGVTPSDAKTQVLGLSGSAASGQLWTVALVSGTTTEPYAYTAGAGGRSLDVPGVADGLRALINASSNYRAFLKPDANGVTTGLIITRYSDANDFTASY